MEKNFAIETLSYAITELAKTRALKRLNNVYPEQFGNGFILFAGIELKIELDATFEEDGNDKGKRHMEAPLQIKREFDSIVRDEVGNIVNNFIESIKNKDD